MIRINMSNMVINKVMSIALAAMLCTTVCGSAIACIGNDYIDTAEAATVKKASTKKVYITASGGKYHVKSCRTIKRSKSITSITIKSAKSRGYKPCKVCFR